MKKRTMGVVIAGIGILLGSLIPSIAATTDASKARKEWVPVEDDIWTVLMDAPAYHFAQAKVALEKKDDKKAATELDMGGRFLKLQEKRLASSLAELRKLETDLKAGRVTSVKELDATVNYAMKSLDHRAGIVPMEEGWGELFVNVPNAHLEKAKKDISNKENKGAAQELRKAAAYMKFKAINAKEKGKEALEASAKELSELAQKLSEDISVAESEVSHVLSRAKAALEHTINK